jgi:formamidopyrimidine-DNA glycosylase
VPELPDVTVYLEAIDARVRGAQIQNVRLASPFVVRTFDPPISAIKTLRVLEIRRVGKRLAFRLENDRWLVIHLMISGRFKWLPLGAKVPGKLGLAAFDFGPRPPPHEGEPAIPEDAISGGTLLLTEAASKKRASIHVVRGEEAVRAMDRGGVEPLEINLMEFRAALVKENHTLKRTLTDPRIFSGIGNSFSDEILHRARLSPVKLSQALNEEDSQRLYEATQRTLTIWTDLLRVQAGGKFPEKVTAFRPEMAVHGKYRDPCPDCGTAVQRIAYADNETDYCPRCQTDGRLLSDRSLARLLKSDWPKTIEELEERMPTRAPVVAKEPPKKQVKKTSAKPG